MKKKASPRVAPAERGKKPINKSQASTSLKRDRLISFIPFAFAFLLYANTLGHGYVLDDDVVYLKNRNVQEGAQGIKDILTHSFTYGFTGLNDRVQSYRPLVLIIYAIEKEFFGNNPHVGHFLNVLLFALSCLLFFKLLKILLGNTFPLLPVTAAVLFAAHPIHTEAVANIKGRDEILNFIFLVLSLTFILRHTDEGRKKYLFLSVLCFFLCLMCKEMAVTFLAIVPLTLLFFREVAPKRIALGMVGFIAAFGVYMCIRNSVLDAVTTQEKMKVVNNALAAATNESDRIATAVYILGKYLLLLFFPHPLSWDYSFNQIPIVSFSEIKVICTILVFAALGAYALFTLIKLAGKPGAGSRKSKEGVYAYCILFFFITMSVVSNIFIMIGATLGERFLFVPSMAFCIAVPFLLNRFGKNSLLGGIGIIVVLFSFKTIDRNKDWKDNFSLFASGAAASPNSSRAESALGSSYREMGEKEQDPVKRGEFFRQAIVYYKKATEILPDNTEALYNAGVSYYGMGDKENALKLYEQVLEISPEYTNAANNAGVIYFERKDYEHAKNYFSQAIKYDSRNSDALGNLGAINHNQGNLQEAIEYYKKALQVNPGNQNVQSNLSKAEQTLKNKQ